MPVVEGNIFESFFLWEVLWGPTTEKLSLKSTWNPWTSTIL